MWKLPLPTSRSVTRSCQSVHWSAWRLDCSLMSWPDLRCLTSAGRVAKEVGWKQMATSQARNRGSPRKPRCNQSFQGPPDDREGRSRSGACDCVVGNNLGHGHGAGQDWHLPCCPGRQLEGKTGWWRRELSQPTSSKPPGRSAPSGGNDDGKGPLQSREPDQNRHRPGPSEPSRLGRL